MKKLLILAMLASTAHGYPTPKHLRGSTIKLKTKDGKVGTYDGNNWKVVRRRVIPAHSVLNKRKLDKNTVFITVGTNDKAYGYCSNNLTNIATKRELSLGVRYQRNFKPAVLSLDVDTTLNSTIGLGFSF